MGFLSAYSSTTKVEIKHPDKEYWVIIKDCLTQGEKTVAENALTQSQFTVGDENVQMSVDVATYRQLMVLTSIKEWNLDDEAGTVWPVDLEHVQGLPGTEFDRIWKIVDEKNKPATSEEKRRFPAGGVSGDQDGRTRTRKSR